MKLGAGMVSEDGKKILAVGGFLLVAVLVLYFELRDPDTPAPAPVAVSAPARQSPQPTSTRGVAGSGSTASGSSARSPALSPAALDPTLHMEAMRVTESMVYSGTGRNIFSATSAPAVVIPKPITPPRPIAVVASAPPPSRPTGPPPPPPIDLKFFGIETFANGTRQAFLSHGEDVFIASAGDIVLRRYRVISIAANSIQIEDIPNNNKQSLPLANQ